MCIISPSAAAWKTLAQRQVAEVLVSFAAYVCSVMSHLDTLVLRGHTSSCRVLQKALWARL